MDKPNVLYVMTDQQPLSTVHAYGNSRIKTPHHDRIAGGVKWGRCQGPGSAPRVSQGDPGIMDTGWRRERKSP